MDPSKHTLEKEQLGDHLKRFEKVLGTNGVRPPALSK